MMPETSCRPAKTKRMMSGIVAATTPAMISARSLKKEAWSSCTATGSVGLLGPSTMNGQKKFVHEATNVKRASMVAAGRAAGSATYQNALISEQPSMRAASTSS